MKTDNEIIAEFMGFEKTGTFYEAAGVRHDKYKSPDFGYTYAAQWAFDTKWSWLMPVVEKIHKNHSIHSQQCRGIKAALISLKIEAVHASVVEFINWYNKQKP